jgi:hypothetical protein
MRILHLISAFDPARRDDSLRSLLSSRTHRSHADCTALASRSAIAQSPAADHTIVAVGGDRPLAMLRQLGLHPRHRLTLPGGFAAPARRSFRKILESRGRFTAIQVWDESLLDLVPRGFPISPPLSLDEQASLIASDPTPYSTTLPQEANLAGGLPVILFGADPADSGDAASLFRVIGLADKSGLRFALVMPRDVMGVRRVVRLHRDAHIAGPLILTDRSVIDWLPAANVVLTVAVKDPREVLFRTLAESRGIPVVTSPAHDHESLGEPSLIEYFAPAATLLRKHVDGLPGSPPSIAIPAAEVLERLVRRWHDASCRDLEPARASV